MSTLSRTLCALHECAHVLGARKRLSGACRVAAAAGLRFGTAGQRRDGDGVLFSGQELLRRFCDPVQLSLFVLQQQLTHSGLCEK